jgi:hypothetical protein
MSGGVSTGGSSELDLIAAGGENFTARMNVFYEAKKQVDAAIAELGLAKAAKDAYDDAQKKLATAKSKLETTNKSVDEMLLNAQEQSRQIIENASVKVAEDNATNSALRKQLEDQLAAAVTDRAAAVADAKAAATESRKASAEAKKATEEALAAKAEAEAKIVAYEDARNRYQSALDNLKATIQSVEIPA